MATLYPPPFLLISLVIIVKGPIYALAGAWLVYVIKNREEVGTNYADGEIVKVLFFGGLNIWVGSDLPVDDW